MTNDIDYICQQTKGLHMQKAISTIIFDLGGVLIDWNPAYLYRKIFATEEEVTHFLTNICTPDWNEEQDAGRSLQLATDILVQKHPEYESAIRAFYGRWEEMLGGPIQGTVDLLTQFHQEKRYRLYALTNWSSETFPIAQARYDFLQLFEGILVSGEEGIKKPDAKIYQLILDRYQLKAEKSIFIDDNLRNIVAAEALGINTIHFKSAEQLKDTLISKAII
jgi:2-haloacid dehalogenase